MVFSPQATDESEASRECVEDQLRKMDRVWAGQLINSSWSAKIWIFSWPDLVFWSNMREPVNSFQGPRAPQCSLCFLFINNHEFSIFSIINNKLLCLDLHLFSPAEIFIISIILDIIISSSSSSLYWASISPSPWPAFKTIQSQTATVWKYGKI